ncbi:hypothetical protein [Bacteroides thetaiotaomicron]
MQTLELKSAEATLTEYSGNKRGMLKERPRYILICIVRKEKQKPILR